MHPEFQEWLDTSLQGPASTDNVLVDLKSLIERMRYDQLHLAEPSPPLEIIDGSGTLLFPGGLRFGLDHNNGQCLDLSAKTAALATRKFGRKPGFLMLPFTGHDSRYFFSPNSTHVFLMFYPREEHDPEKGWVVDPSLKHISPYPNSGYLANRLLPDLCMSQSRAEDFRLKAPGCTPLAMTSNDTLIYFGMRDVNTVWFVHQRPNELPIGFRSAAQLAQLDFMQGEDTILEAARRLEEKVRSALRG